MRRVKFKAVMKRREDGAIFVSDGYSGDSGLSYLFDSGTDRWDYFLEMIITSVRFLEEFPDEGEYLKGWAHLYTLQYAGLKDKNGTEIYEGDIIMHNQRYMSHHEAICKIIFDDRVCMFKATLPPRYDGEYYGMSEHNNMEVIGNIYENPELLS